MITTIADQYLAQNAGRRYPLADDSTGLDDENGNHDNAILDFRCTVRGDRAVARPWAVLDRVMGTGSSAVVTVSVGVGDKTLSVLTFGIPDIAEGSPYTAVSGTARLTVTRAILGVSRRYYGVPFAPSTVTVDGLKVESVQADGGIDRLAGVVRGRIVLEQGKNTDPYLDGNRLRLDIVKGGGTGERCQTPKSAQHCGNVLFSVNGERPGSDGDIQIVGVGGITVTPLPQEHAILIGVGAAAEETLAGQCETRC